MSSNSLRINRAIIAISLIAALVMVACGSESSSPVSGGDEPTTETELPLTTPTTLPGTESTASAIPPAPVLAADEMPTQVTVPDLNQPTSPDDKTPIPSVSPGTGPMDVPAPTVTRPSNSPGPTATALVDAPVVIPPEPTEPPLINTPSPVANLAPDFTLPSVQGIEYSLSQFRGDKPVAVVFYRAYW